MEFLNKMIIIRKFIVLIDSRFFGGNLKKIHRIVTSLSIIPTKGIFFLRNKVEIHLSLNDLMLSQFKNGGFIHSDIVVKKEAILNFTSNKKNPFALYEEMQLKRVGKNWNERFTALIKSYLHKGYLSDSFIQVDKNLVITNGSHRAALALFGGDRYITVEMYNKIHSLDYGIEWFKRNNFNKKDIEFIGKKTQELFKSNSYEYIATIWDPCSAYFDEIVSEIESFEKTTVTEVISLSLSKKQYEGFVRGMYFTDDVSTENIERKISLFKRLHNTESENYELKIVKLAFKDNTFRVKPGFLKLQSLESMRLKKDIRNKYKERVKGYMHDVVFHITDNFHQSEFCNTMISVVSEDFKDLFEKLSGYSYSTIKLENARQAEKFPEAYMLKSDIDLIVDFNQYIEVKNLIENYLDEKFNNPRFEIKIHEDKLGAKLRVELDNFLIFQFHLQHEIEGIKLEVLKKTIELSLTSEKYKLKIPPIKYEMVYRFHEVFNNPRKEWHLEYIREYRENINKKLIKKTFSNAHDFEMIIKRINCNLLK
jgi:hypothetical protein